MEISELFRVSAKGVIFLDGKVLLLRKHTGKWDLPGGRLHADEDIECCLVREATEELGQDVTVGPLIQCNLRRIPDQRCNVVVVAHLCTFHGAFSDIVLSAEHTEAKLFSRSEIDGLEMREVYSKPVQRAFRQKMDERTVWRSPGELDADQAAPSFFERLKARWPLPLRRSL